MKNQFNFPLFSWHLEISSKCALACSRCPRTGESNKHKFKVTELKLDFIQSLFNKDFLGKNVRRILLCGGQGDPIYNSQFLEIVSYLKKTKPDLSLWIVTNGSHKNKSWWKNLSSILNSYDALSFSIDGWDQQSNEMYRKNSDFHSIVQGVQEMTKSAAYIRWSTIIFKFNVNELEKIRDLAKSLGADDFTLVKSTKFGAPWVNQGEEDTLKPGPEFISNSSLYEKTHTFFSKKSIARNDILRKISSREKEQATIYKNSNILPRCQIGGWSWYIDASAIIYPCSWVSHPYDMSDGDSLRNLLLTQKSRFDLSQRSLEDILNDSIWSELTRAWKEGSPIFGECQLKCGNKVTP